MVPQSSVFMQGINIFHCLLNIKGTSYNRSLLYIPRMNGLFAYGCPAVSAFASKDMNRCSRIKPRRQMTPPRTKGSWIAI